MLSSGTTVILVCASVYWCRDRVRADEPALTLYFFLSFVHVGASSTELSKLFCTSIQISTGRHNVRDRKLGSQGHEHCYASPAQQI